MIKLAIIGARGIPANYGGFETFAEELSVNLVQKYNYDVLVVSDLEQKNKNNGIGEYKGVKILYSKYAKQKNALKFYRDSLTLAKDYSLIYSCGPGVGVAAMFANLKNNILITNTDGLNWKRAKWSPLVQKGFKAFEWLSCKKSDYISCDSYGIETYIQKTYNNAKTFVAEYGAYLNPYINGAEKRASEILKEYDLAANEYHLVVSRLEPENNVLPIIKGFSKKKRKYPLAIVGNLSDSKFCQSLKEHASSQVLFLNGIYDKEKLQVVRAKAISYFHGHSVGGTNPSLLEALGSKNLCVCHDNEFNREVTDNNALYFKSENEVDQHVDFLESPENKETMESLRDQSLHRVTTYYNWENIVDKYHEQFLKIKQEKGI